MIKNTFGLVPIARSLMRERAAFGRAALNRCVALLPTAHQVGPGGPIPDTPPPGLENLSEATNFSYPQARKWSWGSFCGDAVA